MSKRLDKYNAKYNSEDVSKAYDNTKDQAVKKQAVSFPQQVNIEHEVKAALSSTTPKVSPITLPYYIIFGKEIYKLKGKHTAEILENEVCILCQKWCSRGLDPQNLNIISNLYLGMACFGIDIETGIIVLWSGTIATVPTGWALCDGNNGTPDLRDKFIVGAKQDDAGVAKTNVTGALTQSGGAYGHNHAKGTLSTEISEDSTNISQTPIEDTASDASHTHAIIGSTATTNELPPYYALAYIMKL